MKKLSLYIFLVLMVCNVGVAEEFTESFVKKLTNSPLPDCKGDDYTKWANCYGRYTNDSGRETISEFGNIPGKRHGLGTSKTLDGKYLEAIFENDKAISGKLFYPNGDTFEGTFNEKGNFEGNGKYTSKNGTYVVGTWVDHKLQGKGTITYPNGNTRHVVFKDGKIIN